MEEEMETTYNQNLKIQEIENNFNRDSVRAIISELFSSYSINEQENALVEFELNY